ncbi:MAG: hypothetical protein JST81_15335 [Bacteroidetes bacterium]|nr:hypothetical protein [Bacteroidota bacterium]
MKKSFSVSILKLAVVCVAAFFTIHASAQSKENEAAFKKGSKTIGFSAGFGLTYDYYGDYNALPAFAITYDQGFFENIGPGNIGIGGIVGIKTASYKYSNSKYKATWNNYIIGARATYHLTILKDKNNKFDPYAGILIGVRIYKYKDSYYSSYGYNPYNYNSAYLEKGVFIGAKYNFSKFIGAFVEAGYDISFFRCGLNVNF